MLFTDRHDAGRKLALRLERLKLPQPVVLALPRGGVPVGFEIARLLGAPLDLVLVRKIGAPNQQELAVAAIADGEPPELVTDKEVAGWLSVSKEYLDAAKHAALQEIQRRRLRYFGDGKPVAIAGCSAIVVDDGVATGATMLAALRVTRRRRPAQLVLAVPVAPDDTLELLREEVDQTVCLETPQDFYAVGQFYRAFPQLHDDEVVELLKKARSFVAPGRA